MTVIRVDGLDVGHGRVAVCELTLTEAVSQDLPRLQTHRTCSDVRTQKIIVPS